MMIREERSAGDIGMEVAVLGRVSRGMTRADTTRVIIREERFAGDIGMEVAVLGRVSRGMTRVMDTTTATRRETRYACPVGKGRLVRDA